MIRAADAAGRRLDYDGLLRVVHENDKQRFAISPDGLRIRANQGHSLAVDLGLAATRPPKLLYHGTVAKFLASIRDRGLLPGARRHVHLSSDEQTAAVVARRRGEPVILAIQASEMAGEGAEFFLSANGVWLAEHVPSRFITFPD